MTTGGTAAACRAPRAATHIVRACALFAVRHSAALSLVSLLDGTFSFSLSLLHLVSLSFPLFSLDDRPDATRHVADGFPPRARGRTRHGTGGGGDDDDGGGGGHSEQTTRETRQKTAMLDSLLSCGYLSSILRLSCGYLSFILRLSCGYLTVISALSHRYLSFISPLSQLYLFVISRASPPSAPSIGSSMAAK